MRGLFVTGTGTGIGKTIASAALLHRYRGEVGIRYWKPVQTGVESDDDTEEVRRLSAATPREIFARGIRLERPLSPHLSARLTGVRIDLTAVAGLTEGEPNTDSWVVEGAGGLLVPLNESQLIPDLIRLLGLPALIAAASGLGTINHTLLTIEALRARAIPVAGVLMIGDANAENRAAIERYGKVVVVGEMPRFDLLTADALGAWSRESLDPAGHLLQFLR
jgi:dethiobiotin synthase